MHTGEYVEERRTGDLFGVAEILQWAARGGDIGHVVPVGKRAQEIIETFVEAGILCDSLEFIQQYDELMPAFIQMLNRTQ